MGNRDIRNLRSQKKRHERFPSDRIAFLDTETAAILDKAVFERYHRKEISIENACKSIAWNNYLPEVTAEQFLKAYKALGFDYEGN